MQYICFIFALSIFFFSHLNAESFYDSYGGYQGRIDDNGRIYDSYGGYQGRINDGGRLYDSYGGYKGIIGK